MSLVNAEFSDFEDRDNHPDGEKRNQSSGSGWRNETARGEKGHQPSGSGWRNETVRGEKGHQPSGGGRRNGRDGLDGMGSSETEFDGVFTEWVRQRLRRHRVELGLSLAGLGTKLGVDWSTVRKWETGETRRCHPSLVPVIGNFLRGYYDRGLRRRLGDFVVTGSCSQCVMLMSLLLRLRGVSGLDGDTLALVEGIIALVRQNCVAGDGGSDV